MAKKTAIAWTRSTFNCWIGCSEVGPGCNNCYARELDKRHKWGGAVHWGAGAPRYRTRSANWKAPLAWEKKAAAGDKPWRVFCASLADVFDNEVDPMWRHDLWKLIVNTPNLSWLIVTKRIGNVASMWPILASNEAPPNVRLLITVCTQEEADRDIQKLLALPSKNGVSYEPALGGVNWRALNLGNRVTLDALTGMHASRAGPGTVEYCLATLPPLPGPYKRGIEWVICGGESTQGAGKARPFVLGWGKDTIRQCRAAAVPVFFKQAGSNATNREGVQHPFKDRAGADPDEWPSDLNLQQFPE